MKLLCGAIVLAACMAGAMAQEGSPLVATTMEFLARATGTSEVLTINITNLIILAVLSGIVIFGGAFIGFGTARSSDSGVHVPEITQGLLTGGMCFMMYTSGDIEKLSCVKRSACEDPKTASDYLSAAKLWYKMHKLMK